MAEMNCSVATGSVKDNYFEEDCFSSKRFLDSLASLFAVQGNCAAILHYNGKFFLSYDAKIDKKHKTQLFYQVCASIFIFTRA